MDGPAEQAVRVDRAARTMATAGAALAGADPGSAALGAGAPGRLGETGRALHAQLTTAVGARAQEAEAAGARLADAAQALRRAAAGYLEVDAAARHRVGEPDRGVPPAAAAGGAVT